MRHSLTPCRSQPRAPTQHQPALHKERKKAHEHAVSGERSQAGNTVPWGTAALETQAGGAGEEKRPLGIALTGRKPAAPAPTGGKKKLDQVMGKHWGWKSHRKSVLSETHHPRHPTDPLGSVHSREENQPPVESQSHADQPASLAGGMFSRSEHHFKKLLPYFSYHCC